jgi:hypothetical protein
MAELQSTLETKPSVFVGNASRACYAEQHGYGFQFELIPNTPLVDASVARTASLLRAFDGTKGPKPQLEEGSWLMYTDAYTYVIDPERSIESMVEAAHTMQTTRMAAAKLAGGEGGCDLIIQEDGATGDPGANAGWFLLRNSEWSRALLQRWAGTRKARKGDYVQIAAGSADGGDDQPALMDLIIHEAGGLGMPVKYDDRCFKEHLQKLPAWKKDKEWMESTEPYSKYCLCWSREMEKLKVGYKKGEGVFLPKVCVLPYPNNVVKGDTQAQLLSVQARDGVNELEARAKYRFLMHDENYHQKIRVLPKWCPRLVDGFCDFMWGQWAPEKRKKWTQHYEKESLESIGRECPSSDKGSSSTGSGAASPAPAGVPGVKGGSTSSDLGAAIEKKRATTDTTSSTSSSISTISSSEGDAESGSGGNNATAIRVAWKRLVGVLQGIADEGKGS